MARKNFLRPLCALVLFGAVPVTAACGGHVISLGNTGSTSSDSLKPIPQATAAATPGACPSGYVHPNICCTGGPGAAPTCGAWEENPLRACDKGATTYPDPLSCCSLTSPKTCIDTPKDAGPLPPPPPPFGCGYVCPPGWWTQGPAVTPGGPEGPSCCTVLADGTTECAAQAGTVPVSSPPVCVSGGGAPTPVPNPVPNPGGPATDAGPAPDGGVVDAGPFDGGAFDGGPAPPPPFDAGTFDGGCNGSDAGDPYPPGFDGGPASLCGVCPPGWTADANQPEVCCQSAPDGTRECFSQATGSASGSGSGGVMDAGVSTPPSTGSGGWGSGSPNGAGPSCSGTTTSCSCEDTQNGQINAIDCYASSAGTFTCTCSVAGKAVGTASGVTSCMDSAEIMRAFSAATSANGCGFN